MATTADSSYWDMLSSGEKIELIGTCIFSVLSLIWILVQLREQFTRQKRRAVGPSRRNNKNAVHDGIIPVRMRWLLLIASISLLVRSVRIRDDQGWYRVANYFGIITSSGAYSLCVILIVHKLTSSLYVFHRLKEPRRCLNSHFKLFAGMYLLILNSALPVMAVYNSMLPRSVLYCVFVAVFWVVDIRGWRSAIHIHNAILKMTHTLRDTDESFISGSGPVTASNSQESLVLPQSPSNTDAVSVSRQQPSRSRVTRKEHTMCCAGENGWSSCCTAYTHSPIRDLFTLLILSTPLLVLATAATAMVVEAGSGTPFYPPHDADRSSYTPDILLFVVVTLHTIFLAYCNGPFVNEYCGIVPRMRSMLGIQSVQSTDGSTRRSKEYRTTPTVNASASMSYKNRACEMGSPGSGVPQAVREETINEVVAEDPGVNVEENIDVDDEEDAQTA